eukprot:scaffold42342_cov52-Attheya_sp.AAC.5
MNATTLASSLAYWYRYLLAVYCIAGTIPESLVSYPLAAYSLLLILQTYRVNKMECHRSLQDEE